MVSLFSTNSQSTSWSPLLLEGPGASQSRNSTPVHLSSRPQLVLTVGLLAVVVYLYTVVAFNFFRKFYNKSEDDDEPDMKCDDMMTVSTHQPWSHSCLGQEKPRQGGWGNKQLWHLGRIETRCHPSGRGKCPGKLEGMGVGVITPWEPTETNASLTLG